MAWLNGCSGKCFANPALGNVASNVTELPLELQGHLLQTLAIPDAYAKASVAFHIMGKTTYGRIFGSGTDLGSCHHLLVHRDMDTGCLGPVGSSEGERIQVDQVVLRRNLLDCGLRSCSRTFVLSMMGARDADASAVRTGFGSRRPHVRRSQANCRPASQGDPRVSYRALCLDSVSPAADGLCSAEVWIMLAAFLINFAAFTLRVSYLMHKPRPQWTVKG